MCRTVFSSPLSATFIELDTKLQICDGQYIFMKSYRISIMSCIHTHPNTEEGVRRPSRIFSVFSNLHTFSSLFVWKYLKLRIISWKLKVYYVLEISSRRWPPCGPGHSSSATMHLTIKKKVRIPVLINISIYL